MYCLVSSATSLLLSSSFLMIILSSTSAFNITQILTPFPEFRTYNDYLIQTNLADQINNRQVITVLVVDNGAMSTIAKRSMDVIKKVLSLHVVLDYYDVQKLLHLPNRSVTLTTMFQTTGEATGLQGFLNVTVVGTGGVSIAWAAGSGVGANVVKAVVSQPYNISVVQISTLIMPSTIVNTNSSSNSSSSSPPPSQSPPSPSPAASQSPTPNPNPNPPSRAKPPRKAASGPSNAISPSADQNPPADGHKDSDKSYAPPKFTTVDFASVVIMIMMLCL
ncbi:hypothetical protein FNV43_RR27246 [Rhamnella rubrinervis]|uniref:FAS1 domain-containing protein n=1 Tax=Rhamnella rubrinervis TaxID=2594499 RepID=A0A8K0GPI1_9ROSA|nr:hypothetical protein FNV43_RR27246 [Rhamnella rubrinervis]